MKIGLIVLVVVILVITALFLYSRVGATISGKILDCKTQQPVGGVSITAAQRGWGFAPYPVWDKDYIEDATSADDGSFSINLPIKDSAQLSLKREGYIDTIEYKDPGADQKIGILSGTRSQFNKPPGYVLYTTNCTVQ
jgi:hypothetical protein